MKELVTVPLVLMWRVAGPITYILCVVDTWHQSVSVPVKLLINLTLDAFLAVVWPGTWLLWGITAAIGFHTPLAMFR
jgi:hypothetical protein